MLLDKVCVTMKPFSESSMAIQVLDKEKKRSPRFLICNYHIDDIFEHAYVEDTDIYNTCNLTMLGNGKVAFRMMFLSVDCDDHVHGYRRYFEIPVDELKRARAGETIKLMSQTEHASCTPRITLTENAHAAVKKMSKAKRRAFVKALDSFNLDEDIVIGKDFGSDFLFTQKNAAYKVTINGGLCLHRVTVRGKDGEEHDAVVYGKHT